jgi:cytochrome b561
MNKYEKILHWLILLAFLGLCATALAAEYFFSKEAILDSFKKSLPMINATIAPVDQFFVSRIARRDTWDVHLYIGLAFFGSGAPPPPIWPGRATSASAT